jgi:PPE-repeat protein
MSYGMGSPTGANSGNYGKEFKEKVPSGYKAGTLQQYTPQQNQLFEQSFSHVSPDSYLGRLAGGDESLYAEMEAPALRQFGELQGGMASKFSNAGMGSRRSSGFQNTMNQAGADFAQQLQSNRQSLRQQAIKDLMGMSSELLDKRPYERYLTPKEPSFMDKWLGMAANTMGVASQAQMGGM